MNTHLHPIVLEARFAQLAVALLSGVDLPAAALDAVGEQARRALRGFDALVIGADSARLGRSASRLARTLLRLHGDGVPIELGIVRLGIEMGHLVDPLGIAAVVRRVRDGSAQLPVTGTPSDDAATAKSTLFAQLALITALARSPRA